MRALLSSTCAPVPHAKQQYKHGGRLSPVPFRSCIHAHTLPHLVNGQVRPTLGSGASMEDVTRKLAATLLPDRAATDPAASASDRALARDQSRGGGAGAGGAAAGAATGAGTGGVNLSGQSLLVVSGWCCMCSCWVCFGISVTWPTSDGAFSGL